ncbi:hypothetical protein ACFOYU_10380 [Microvirga sp. GCM10011540]|uniref:hypothetical protein n=1 Tax=Microvirga sp. GCM10011540 TaxID=3317338 RepID=UPI003620C4FD
MLDDEDGPPNEALFGPTPPPGELWVSLALPDVARLSDEQLAQWFPNHDGRWTAQTKALISQFGATGLDLNRNWAEVPPGWQCVCCRRTKPEIVRKADNGVLVAHLEWHHDHITDLFGRRLNDRFGMPWTQGVPEVCRLADGPIKALLWRFRDALICDACNRADGKAKDALKAEVHPDFTFTPGEISQFIMPHPNRHHEIDVDCARAIWRGAREDFADRIAFMDLMVERLADGRHGVERNRAAEGSSPQQAADRILARMGIADPSAQAFTRWHGRLSFDLADRSTMRDGAGRSARTRPARGGRGPTDEEFAAFDQRAQLGWKRAPADWTCPCCGRGKREILRLSGQGRWFAQIRDHQVFPLEHDPRNLEFRQVLYPWHPPELVIREYAVAKVCSDCGDVASELQRSRPDLIPFHLGLEDLRACLGEVRPNEKLEIVLGEAAARAQTNEPWIAAREAFVQHHDLATSMNALRAGIEGRRALGREDWAEIAALAEDQGVSLDARPGALAWLIQEGQRFSRG